MNDKITIAIDGWSSCGKSTLAKALAERLNYIYVDSGAMYRGVTFYAMEQGLLDHNDIKNNRIIDAIKNLSLRFEKGDSGQLELVLNGKRVEEKIRSLEVSNQVSQVAAIKAVRTFLVDQQRLMGRNGGVVMDGRDIGSVVFPNAELKLFITADLQTRAKRRYQELKNKGDAVSLEQVRSNLSQRDHLDTTREESPLVKTDDAIVIDNSALNQQEQLQKALDLVEISLKK